MLGFFRNRHLERLKKVEEILHHTRQKLQEAHFDKGVTDAAYEALVSDHEEAIQKNKKSEVLVSEFQLMLRICRDSRLVAENEAKFAKEQLQAATFKLDSATEAIKIFADRYKISASELRQLQVADLLPAEEGKQGFEKATAQFEPFDAGDALVLLNAGNDFKQTSGKFRQLRQNFVTLQLALTKMFDGLERQAKKKPVTVDQIRDVRKQASEAIGRKI